MPNELTPSPTGESAPTDDEDLSPHQKYLADWAMGLLSSIYGQDVMARRFPAQLLPAARRRFATALYNMTPHQLAYGQRQLERDSGDWPPSAGKLAQMCIQAPEHRFHVKQLEHKADPKTARRWIQKMKEDLQ